MSPTLFIFGNTPDLAFEELKIFYPSVSRISETVALLRQTMTDSPEKLLEKLGGTVKIAEGISEVLEITVKVFVDVIISQKATSHLTFGVSSYNALFHPTGTFLASVKQELSLRDIPARYVEAKDGNALTSVVIKKQNVVEYCVIKSGANWLIAKTAAVQDFEAWSARDVGRPASDAKNGMLPVKVARMIVNMAGEIKDTHAASPVLLDPFCGMGTVLAEGMLSGWYVIGCDISAEAVEKSRRNLDWLTLQNFRYAGGTSYELHIGDATHASDFIKADSVDAIVTEPYMGSATIGEKPAMTAEKIKNTMKGLEKLYIGCLRDWYGLLKKEGKIIIAFPEYSLGGRLYFVKKVIDTCENLGYTVQTGPIVYSRPQAVVRRKFFVLKKFIF